jgi:hypothetical protein
VRMMGELDGGRRMGRLDEGKRGGRLILNREINIKHKSITISKLFSSL